MSHSPSIAPDDTDREIHIVLEDYGSLGRAWIAKREADRATLIQDLLDGQYEEPVRIVAFNTCRRLVTRCDPRYRRRTSPTLRRIRRSA